jgi:hypothetical protein
MRMRSKLDGRMLLFFTALIVSGAVFAWEVASVRFSVDDAYITYSFSKNLARGAGPLYGHGVRVEGYSNFLWMVLVAIPLAVARDADPLMLARGLTVVFVVMLLGATYSLARMRSPFSLSLAAAGLVAINPNLLLAFKSGLETVPYAALVTVGFLLYLRWADGRHGRPYHMIAFLAAALMRIDGFIPLGFIIGYDVVASVLERRFSIREQLRLALPALFVWGLWFTWRWNYYGLPLPSTYYAKALIPELMPRRGELYVLDELYASGLFVSLVAYCYLLWQRHRPALPVGLFAIGQLVYAAHVGGDWMPSGRFVLPAFPLLFVISSWAAADAIAVVRGLGRLIGVLAWLPFSAGIAWLVARTETHLTSSPLIRRKLAAAAEQEEHVERLKEAARYLALVVPSGGRLVTDYGGVLAYYTDAAPIEMWGLCNAEIATKGNAERVNPEYGRTCPACYADLNPEYFHLLPPLLRRTNSFARHEDVVMTVWQTDTIGRYLDFSRDFVSGRIVDTRTGKALWFLERKRPGWLPKPRRASRLMVVEYPFVAGGLLSRT